MICSQDVVFFDDKNELLGELLSYQEINWKNGDYENKFGLFDL